MEHQADVCADILRIIRDRSVAGRLISAEEILTGLKGQGILESEDVEQKMHLKTLLKRVMQEHQVIREISAGNGIAYYHSVESLSETYAGILAWKSENPLVMIAEVVRKNSRLYPRPVSVDSFLEPPFGLTGEEIVECLTAMGQQKEYEDIAQTTTSIGTQFLYSTKHFGPDHALTLAEWLDVGQVNNP